MRWILLLLVTVLASCSFSPPDVQTVARAVTLPPKAKPVDLAPATKQSDAVAEANRQLRDQVASGRRSSYELNRHLAVASAKGMATADELAVVKGYALEVEGSLSQAEEIIEDQGVELLALGRSLAQATGEVEVSEFEKDVLRNELGEAKEDVEKLTRERDTGVANLAAAKVSIDVEKTWKWRFLKWAVVVTTLGLVYVLLRLKFAWVL